MKKGYFGRLLAAVLAAALTCTAFSGCTRGGADNISAAQPYEAPDKDSTGTLKLLVSEQNKTAFDNAKSKFKQKYPKTTVEIVTYDNMSTDSTELEKQFSRQMMGDGADIIEMYPYAFSEICDPRKVEQAGAFIDLATYFNNDPDWSWEGYSVEVVNGIMCGNKLYRLPLYFTPALLFTTDTLLAESGINLKKCDTGIGLLNELTRCAEKTNEGATDLKPMDFNSIYFWELDVDPVSFENGKGKVKFTKDFDKAIEAYDAAGQQLGWFEPWTEEKNAEANRIMNQGTYVRLIKNRTLFVRAISMYSDFQDFRQLASMEHKPVYVPIYTADGSGISAEADSTVSVASSCKNPELAYEFVKCLLSEEAQLQCRTQADGSIYYYAGSQPLKQSAAEKLIESENHFSYEVVNANGETETVTSADYAKQLIDFADQVVHTYAYTYFSKSAEEYFYPYFRREKSFDDCYDNAEEQLEIYATE